jgi:predicted phage terminase large subunit-like protein
MRRLVVSDWYQKRWGDRVKLTGDQNAKTKFENTASGFREAIATGSITGARGDIDIIDDPHSVEGAASDQMRRSTIEWFLEALPTRLNNPERSAIIVDMQRLHEEDVSGVILSKGLGYEHLCLPMEFEPSLRCETSIGFIDPREEAGELLFPERFPAHVVARDKHAMGPYAVAGQFQQLPSPRGGGIIKREWWIDWDKNEALFNGIRPDQDGRIVFPVFDYVLASLDTAYDEKADKGNDPSALSVWGVWTDRDENRRVMLMAAWEDWLELHPLVAKVARTCQRFKIDNLLIEAKASGKSVAQEIRRLYAHEGWGVQMIDPGRIDKIARAYSVQHIWSGGLVYAPDREWADKMIDQCSVFPRGKHDDLVDTATQAIRHLRDIGLIQRPEEISQALTAQMQHRSIDGPIYPV